MEIYGFEASLAGVVALSRRVCLDKSGNSETLALATMRLVDRRDLQVYTAYHIAGSIWIGALRLQQSVRVIRFNMHVWLFPQNRVKQLGERLNQVWCSYPFRDAP